MEESNQPDLPLRWSIAQRLEFIEFRLLWEGRINRADVAERFSVSMQQASGDLGLYEGQAPENMTYDRNAKRFVPALTFHPKFLHEVANRHLLQLAAIGNGLVDPSETWFHDLPPIGVVKMPQRSVSTMTVRWVLEAVRSSAQLKIEYQSLNRVESAMRTIEPHSLGHDGTRWHVRAYCVRNKEFRDFVLSRIVAAEALGKRTIDPQSDREWFDEVDLALAPNPELPESARRGLAREYGMSRGKLHIPTRVALAFYLIQHLNLDLKLPPKRQQLVLDNLKEVEDACARAKQATLEALSA
jgi:hypothetical protein